MSKHRQARKAVIGRGWRALCSAVPLFVIIATMFVVPPVAIAQTAPPAPAGASASGATGAPGATGAIGATGASGDLVTPAPTDAPAPTNGGGSDVVQSDPAGPPTIASDLADYPPGATVTLTGTNWADGESVRIVVNDTLGQTWKHTADVTANSAGVVTDVFNLPNVFVSDYDVTATGPTSGTATTTFTDAPKITAKQHEGQESVGTYTSGNITTYKEGDYINFHFTIDSASAASGHMEIRFTENDGNCLFFDGTFALAQIDNPYTGAVENAPAVVTLSGSTPAVTTIGSPVAQNSGTSSGEWVQLINVVFTAAGSAQVNYHLRLSDFAGRCSGSSQHSRIAEPPTGKGDFEATGAQNVPVPGQQVIELPDITVIKRIDRNGDGTFESLASAGEYRFCLDVSTCLSTDANGQVQFINVTPDGAHAITEQQLLFNQGTYVFDSVVNATNCVQNGTAATATVAAGATPTNATCTFRNKANQGQIELRKAWVGTGGQTTLRIGTAQNGTQVDSQLTGACLLYTSPSPRDS